MDEKPVKKPFQAGAGVGVVEAPRGILYHMAEVDERGMIVGYDVIVPTSQNQINIENDLKKYFSDFNFINIGGRADLIIWDYIPPNFFNSDNFWGHYVYGILDRPVHSVVQNGKVLMNDFRIKIDESEYNVNIFKQGNRLYEKFQSSS